jgi:hypothetical protein
MSLITYGNYVHPTIGKMEYNLYRLTLTSLTKEIKARNSRILPQCLPTGVMIRAPMINFGYTMPLNVDFDGDHIQSPCDFVMEYREEFDDQVKKCLLCGRKSGSLLVIPHNEECKYYVTPSNVCDGDKWDKCHFKLFLAVSDVPKFDTHGILLDSFTSYRYIPVNNYGCVYVGETRPTLN